ncbi:MAG: hypothetical protein GY782_09810 [Gammaproteobacteria bacterium]|nr:hypothetical protein [Gammaproteobacteria bacterium]
MSFNYQELPPEDYSTLTKYFNATPKRIYSNDKSVVALSTDYLSDQFGDEDQWPEGLKKALAPYKVDKKSANFSDYRNKEVEVFSGTNILYDSENYVAGMLEKETIMVSDWLDKQERHGRATSVLILAIRGQNRLANARLCLPQPSSSPHPLLRHA